MAIKIPANYQGFSDMYKLNTTDKWSFPGQRQPVPSAMQTGYRNVSHNHVCNTMNISDHIL